MAAYAKGTAVSAAKSRAEWAPVRIAAQYFSIGFFVAHLSWSAVALALAIGTGLIAATSLRRHRLVGAADDWDRFVGWAIIAACMAGMAVTLLHI